MGRGYVVKNVEWRGYVVTKAGIELLGQLKTNSNSNTTTKTTANTNANADTNANTLCLHFISFLLFIKKNLDKCQ